MSVFLFEGGGKGLHVGSIAETDCGTAAVR